MKEYTSYVMGPGESYGIPYRCLAVRGLTNLLTAGRCISTDRSMQASVRVMPGCYITGQAAGMAAAVLCDAHSDDVHSIDVHQLQNNWLESEHSFPIIRNSYYSRIGCMKYSCLLQSGREYLIERIKVFDIKGDYTMNIHFPWYISEQVTKFDFAFDF